MASIIRGTARTISVTRFVRVTASTSLKGGAHTANLLWLAAKDVAIIGDAMVSVKPVAPAVELARAVGAAVPTLRAAMPLWAALKTGAAPLTAASLTAAPTAACPRLLWGTVPLAVHPGDGILIVIRLCPSLDVFLYAVALGGGSAVDLFFQRELSLLLGGACTRYTKLRRIFPPSISGRGDDLIYVPDVPPLVVHCILPEPFLLKLASAGLRGRRPPVGHGDLAPRCGPFVERHIKFGNT
jgi:hypothetical protein